MAKKNKKKQLQHRSQEKRIVARRRFDLTMATIIMLFLAATLLCRGRNYELGVSDPIGYLYWLLLVPAYLPLEAIGLLTALLPIETSGFAGHEAVILGGCDLAMTIVIWIWVRLASNSRNLEFLTISRHFALIFLCWAVFQFLLLAVTQLWDHGGLSEPFHPHLHRAAATETAAAVKADTPPCR